LILVDRDRGLRFAACLVASRISRVLLFVLLLAGCDCGKHDSPARNEQGAHPQTSNVPALPPPSGTPLPADSLQQKLPDTLAGASPTGPATLHRLPLANGGVMTMVRRTYKQDGREIEVDLGDALHAPVPRQLVVSQQGTARRSEQSIFLGESVNGQPALVQWHGPSKTALAHLVIADRFLVNLRVSPADDEKPARDAAKALPLDALAAFAKAQPGSGEQPSAEPAASQPAKTTASTETKTAPSEPAKKPAPKATKAAPATSTTAR